MEKFPANDKADVCVPAPANKYTAVFKPLGFDVQVEPSYNSVAVKKSCSTITTKS
jgi:hypothetical protein